MKTLTKVICGTAMLCASQVASANELTEAVSATISAQVESFVEETHKQIKQSAANMLATEWEKLTATESKKDDKEVKKQEQKNEQ